MMIKEIAEPKKIAKPTVPIPKPSQPPIKKEIPTIISPMNTPIIETMY